ARRSANTGARDLESADERVEVQRREQTDRDRGAWSRPLGRADRARQWTGHRSLGAPRDLRAGPARTCRARNGCPRRRPRVRVRPHDRARPARQARLRIAPRRDRVPHAAAADSRARATRRTRWPRSDVLSILIVEDDEAIATGLALNLKLA